MHLLPSNAMLLVSALSFSCTTLQSAPNVVLAPEVLQFIPSCAQPCFERFISYEFPSVSPRPTALSLDWLCTQNVTTSGDLIGAGAGDCVQVAIKEGYCNKLKDDPVSHLDVEIARNMCSREEAANDPVSSDSGLILRARRRLMFCVILKIAAIETERLSWSWTHPLRLVFIPTTAGGNIVLWLLCVISTGSIVAALRSHYHRQKVWRLNLDGSSALFQPSGEREKCLVEDIK